MSELASKKISGRKVEVGDFGAKEGWSLLHRLTSICGPTLADLTDDDASPGIAIRGLFEKLTEDEMFDLMDKLTSLVLVDGAKWSEQHFKDYLFTFEVMGFVLEHNYKDFFSLIKESMAVLLREDNP